MKEKTTQKHVKQSFDKVISVPYCRLYWLLSRREPYWYTCGVYGWNADVYNAGYHDGSAVAIVTGYRPFGNIAPSYELCRIYEILAEKTYRGSWTETNNALDELLRDFIGDAIREADEKKAAKRA